MIVDVQLPLQSAMRDWALADAALVAMIGQGFYDGIPSNAVKPYVSFGPFDVAPPRGDCIEGSTVVVQLDAWAVGPKTVEAKQVAGLLMNRFHLASFPMPAPFHVVSCEFVSTLSGREPDGLTARGIVIFSIRAEPRD